MKQDITQYNKNKNNKPHGLWLCYYPSGSIWFKGQFINDKNYGYWIFNFENESEITFYIK